MCCEMAIAAREKLKKTLSVLTREIAQQVKGRWELIFVGFFFSFRLEYPTCSIAKQHSISSSDFCLTLEGVFHLSLIPSLWGTRITTFLLIQEYLLPGNFSIPLSVPEDAVPSVLVSVSPLHVLLLGSFCLEHRTVVLLTLPIGSLKRAVK